MSQLYREALLLSRQKMTLAQRKASYRAVFRARYPMALELAFSRLLRKATTSLTADLVKRFMSFKNQWQSEVRQDSIQGRFAVESEDDQQKKVLAILSLSMSVDLDKEIKELLDGFNSFEKGELDRYLAFRLKKALPYTDDWMSDLSKSVLKEVQSRLTDTMLEIYDKVRDRVVQGVKDKETYQQVMSAIREIDTTISQKRAGFIARDLSGKIHSEITKNIHLNVLGIRYYTWQSEADELVRGRPGGKYSKAIPSHWAMENKVCKWEDSGVYSSDRGKTFLPRESNMPKLHPGQDWGCRCRASPWDLDILNEVDAFIPR